MRPPYLAHARALTACVGVLAVAASLGAPALTLAREGEEGAVWALSTSADESAASGEPAVSFDQTEQRIRKEAVSGEPVVSHSQTEQPIPAEAVSGTDLFRAGADDSLAILEPKYLGESLESLSPDPAVDASAPDMVDEFWAWDFVTSEYYKTTADLRYEGDRAWIYVERGQTVSQADIDMLGTLFESQILPRTRDTFGGEPNPGVDGREAVTLLLLDVRDGFSRGGPQYVSGYFLPVNQHLQSDLDAGRSNHRSNEAEMVYLDVEPTVPSGAIIRQTLAHELQHLVAWNHDRDEEPWLDEALSELAVYVAGLGHPDGHVRAFLGQPGGTLTTWTGSPADYGRGYMFLLYVLERRAGGDEWIADLVADPSNGLAALATSVGGEDALAALFADYAVALHHDDQTGDGGRYGYESLDLGAEGGYPLPAASIVDPRSSAAAGPVVQAEAELSPWSFAAFRTELGAGGLELRLTPSQAVCVTASSRGQARERPVIALEEQCVGPGESAQWSYSPTGSGTRGPLVQAIVANTTGLDIALAVDAAPAVARASHFSILLPLIVAR